MQHINRMPCRRLQGTVKLQTKKQKETRETIRETARSVIQEGVNK